LIGALLAATDGAPSAPPAAPSAELLLYLAEFADADGRFVDPTEISADAAAGDDPDGVPETDDEPDEDAAPDRVP
jgi:hypothetical protein